MRPLTFFAVVAAFASNAASEGPPPNSALSMTDKIRLILLGIIAQHVEHTALIICSYRISPPLLVFD
jgi:hypothetical protein